MNIAFRLGKYALCGVLLLLPAMAQDPDNTKKNERDRQGTTATADKQSQNPADRELARQIRRAITSDKAMSTYAKNVKIVVNNGEVTLRGPVRTEEEKNKIEEVARKNAGTAKVINELEVAPKEK
jgi:hyperosmotically inducible periplasmic protein